MTATAVPFVDLHAQYLALKGEIDAAMAAVIADTAFVGGPRVGAFEAAFAEATGAAHCVALANGTDAIYVALTQLGVGPGDEVLVPALTWISTAETVSQAGATPVFVDVDPVFLTMDAAHARACVTERTRAMIPVHLYGQAADLDGLGALCAEHGLHLVEDCAQAHLTRLRGRAVGTFGAAGAFSFYPGKNLGAYGDAGAVVTSDAALAGRMRMFANHGQRRKHDHRMPGINSRLDGLQAAVLGVKLPHLPAWNAARRRHAAHYTRLLADTDGLRLPEVRPETEHTFHLYVVRTDRRDELKAYLEAQGIEVAVHYPAALPDTPAYSAHRAAECPEARRAAAEILSLPIFPELAPEQVEHVAAHVRAFFGA